jgi:uncharacterized membrane protein
LSELTLVMIMLNPNRSVGREGAECEYPIIDKMTLGTIEKLVLLKCWFVVLVDGVSICEAGLEPLTATTSPEYS